MRFGFARMKTAAAEASELLATMANANRLLVLCNLVEQEMSVQALAGAVGMNQSALSQQLARLRALKLVATRREGRTINYRLASPEVARILQTLYAIYCAPAEEPAADRTGAAKLMPGRQFLNSPPISASSRRW